MPQAFCHKVGGIVKRIVVKGGAILCHGAEQGRTTGRSVFSMSVTLRWASAGGT